MRLSARHRQRIQQVIELSESLQNRCILYILENITQFESDKIDFCFLLESIDSDQMTQGLVDLLFTAMKNKKHINSPSCVACIELFTSLKIYHKYFDDSTVPFDIFNILYHHNRIDLIHKILFWKIDLHGNDFYTLDLLEYILSEHRVSGDILKIIISILRKNNNLVKCINAINPTLYTHSELNNIYIELYKNNINIDDFGEKFKNILMNNSQIYRYADVNFNNYLLKQLACSSNIIVLEFILDKTSNFDVIDSMVKNIVANNFNKETIDKLFNKIGSEKYQTADFCIRLHQHTDYFKSSAFLYIVEKYVIFNHDIIHQIHCKKYIFDCICKSNTHIKYIMDKTSDPIPNNIISDLFVNKLKQLDIDMISNLFERTKYSDDKIKQAVIDALKIAAANKLLPVAYQLITSKFFQSIQIDPAIILDILGKNI